MKSKLLMLLFCSFIFGTSFSQKDENHVDRKNKVFVTKLESPNKLSPTPKKIEIKQQKEVVLDNSIKRDTEQPMDQKNTKADISDETAYENLDILKKIENGQVVLNIPNLNDNLTRGNAEDYISRVQNHFDVISEIKFSENKNIFKVVISDLDITNKPDLLNSILSQFGINNYTLQNN